MKKLLPIFCLLISCTQRQEPAPIIENTNRYELIQLGSLRRDQFLLDKKTGQIWTKNCLIQGKESADCSYIAWIKDDVEGVNKTLTEIIETRHSYGK